MFCLRDLYQEVIIDHNRNPRNFHTLQKANRCANGHNPLCGDRINLYLSIENNTIQEVSFTGRGCAISTASASLMTESIKGKSVLEAQALFSDVHTMLTGENSQASARTDKLGVLAGVKEFPARVKCATLAWHTLIAALSEQVHAISETID